jgi:hypothetical protein
MAPNLAESQHAEIRDMILSKSLTVPQMAEVAGCSARSIRAIRSTLRYFGTIRALRTVSHEDEAFTPPMLDTLCEHLLEQPELYQDEMAVFLWDEFDVLVTTFSVGRALASIGWTKKTIHKVAKARNADLRDFYLHNISEFERSFPFSH